VRRWSIAIARAFACLRRRAIATEKSNATIAAEQIKRAQTNLELATRTAERLRPLAGKPMCRPSNSIKRNRRNVTLRVELHGLGDLRLRHAVHHHSGDNSSRLQGILKPSNVSWRF
jgi:hypothetical protein